MADNENSSTATLNGSDADTDLAIPGNSGAITDLDNTGPTPISSNISTNFDVDPEGIDATFANQATDVDPTGASTAGVGNATTSTPGAADVDATGVTTPDSGTGTAPSTGATDVDPTGATETGTGTDTSTTTGSATRGAQID